MSPPAHVQRVELGRTYRFKRRRDRRIFSARLDDASRDVVTMRPLRSRHARTIARARLLADFDQVERCPSCGWHHKLKRIPARCVR